MLTFIDRLVTAHYSVYPNRPITGIVLHNTESAGPLRVDQSQGSWHWLIDHDEDGTLYCDVSEKHAAWGVFATGHSAASIAKTKWRPPWLVRCPDDGVSDANYCAIHIEMVSYQGYRDDGIPYTRGQYVTLAALIRDLFARRGVLPIVGHGQVQTDRSDPVAFDWDRLTNLLETTEDDMAKLTDDQRAILDKMAGLNANSGSIDSWVSTIGAYEKEIVPRLQGRISELETLISAQVPIPSRVEVIQANGRRDGFVPET
jgi:hypothetical protein